MAASRHRTRSGETSPVKVMASEHAGRLGLALDGGPVPAVTHEDHPERREVLEERREDRDEVIMALEGIEAGHHSEDGRSSGMASSLRTADARGREP